MSEGPLQEASSVPQSRLVDLDVWVLGEILARRRRTVLLTFAFLLVAGVAMAVLLPRKYAAETLLRVSQAAGGEMSPADVELIADYVAATREESTVTHAELLRSDDNLGRALASLTPEERAAFPRLPWRLPVEVKGEKEPGSHLLRITVTSPNVPAAIALANAIADTYVETVEGSNRQVARAVTRSLQPELTAANTRLAAAQETLAAARKQARIYAFQTEYSRAVDRLGSVTDSIRDLEIDLAVKRATLAKAESVLATLPPMTLESRKNARDVGRDELEKSVADLSLAEKTTALVYAEGSPEMKMARDRLAAARKVQAQIPAQSLSEEEKRANVIVRQLEQDVTRYRVEIVSADRRLSLLREEQARVQKRLEDLNGMTAEMRRLETDVGTKQTIRDTLEEKAQQMIVNTAARLSTIQIASRAAPPLRPAGVPRRLQVLVAGAVGVILGVAVALVQETADLRRRGVTVQT